MEHWKQHLAHINDLEKLEVQKFHREQENIKHDIITKHMVPMNVKAGEAVILDDSVVHYSNINQTDGLRLAIQLILIPEEEKSIHYHVIEKR